MTFLIQLLLGIVSLVLFFLVIKKIKRKLWLNNLKVGDDVNVTIYSKNCECQRKAKVTKIDNNITAKINKEIYDKCKKCSEKIGTDENGYNTCLYYVEEFKKNDVNKI